MHVSESSANSNGEMGREKKTAIYLSFSLNKLNRKGIGVYYIRPLQLFDEFAHVMIILTSFSGLK